MKKSTFYIVGRHAVVEALKNPLRRVVRVFLTEDSKKKIHKESPNINVLKNTFNTGLPYISSKSSVLNRGELGIQGSRPAEIIKLWLGLRFLGMQGIEHILNLSIERRKYFEKNLNKEKYEPYSGPLHIISFLPKGMNKIESDAWTLKKRNSLINNNFMLSRPEYKNRFFLRVVLGNFNTSENHINELLKLLV